MKREKVFCFDIDGVIATIVPDNNYEHAQPIWDTIHIINELYQSGHRIILLTARGSTTGIDWRVTTENQLRSWRVRYHSLAFGKPAADFYVDDKAVPVDQLQGTVNRLNEAESERKANHE